MIQMMDKRSQDGRIKVYISVETDEQIFLTDEIERNIDDAFALIERTFAEAPAAPGVG